MPSIREVAEQLEERINYIKMLIRGGQVNEALQHLDVIEEETQSYNQELPPAFQYLIPFTRGRAYMQLKQSNRARPQLELALKLAADDIEAGARVRNLLGAILYSQEQPAAAVKCHLECVRAISEGKISDFNFRFSVYYNLGNAYLASGDMPHAIGNYKKALLMLKDLDAPERAADVHWGLALAYKAQCDWRAAKLQVSKAIRVYKATDNLTCEAAMQINLAEILIEEGRDCEAAMVLNHAHQLLAGTSYLGLLSYVHHCLADLARRNGDLEGAAIHIAESIEDAELVMAHGQNPDNNVWIERTRALAEAVNASALIEEARGNSEEADRLFYRAIELIEQTTVQVAKHTIHMSFGHVLEARDAYKEAARHYRIAAEYRMSRSQPRIRK